LFQGVCLSSPSHYTTAAQLAKLFVHEAERVFSDRMLSEEETGSFSEILAEITKKFFPNTDQAELHARPIVFTNFANSADGSYQPCKSVEELKKTLDAKLQDYNESA